MFLKYADFIVKRRWLIISLWIIAAILVISMSPKLSSVTSNDQSSFIPSKYESVQAQEIAKASFPETQGQTAVIVFKDKNGKKLSNTDKQKIVQVVAALNAAKIDNIESISTAPQLLSQDGKMQLAQAQLASDVPDTELTNSIKNMRSNLSSQLKSSNLSSGITGSVAISYDIQDSAKKGEMIVGGVTVLLILILPTIIFRSVFPALLSLTTIGVLYAMTTALLALAAKMFNFTVSGQLTPLLIVVLFGIGTDYILFLLFRYRERLKTGDHTRNAVSFAMTRAGEAILSAALVVGIAFAALFTASLKTFSSMAPGLVIAVTLMLLAAMSLIPAILAIIGGKIFWPSKKWQTEHTGTLATKIGKLVARRPMQVAAVIVIFLLVLASGVLHYKASFSVINQLPASAESTVAFKDLSNSFPAGTASPISIYIKSDHPLSQQAVAKVAQEVAKAPNIAYVSKPQFTTTRNAALVTAILSIDPNSVAAMKVVAGPITRAAHSTDLNQQAHIAVGGETASNADLKKATNRDLQTTIPLAAILIFIILAILLRSLVAPIYLLLAVGLGVLATLGLTTYAFISIGGSTGLIYLLPILLYIFVVAVGTDYNILMISRLHEEIHTEGNSPKIATERAIEHSAATLVSAGVILAGTFGSLSFAGLSLMTQLGFSIAIGISLGAFLISLMLIPAISTMLGKWVWWPRHEQVRKD